MCMTILPKRYKLSIPSLSLNNADLVYTDSIKYLVVVLNNNFLMTTEISVASWDAYMQAQILFYVNLHVVRKTWSSITWNRIVLFIFCSDLWCDYSMSSISKLRVAYNNVFRNLLDYGSRDSASSMFAINAIDTYEARMRKAYFTFRQRLLSSTNNIVTCINTNTWLRHNYMWRKWDTSLYICHNYWMFHIILTNVCGVVI